MDPEQNEVNVKPPTTFKEQVKLFKDRNMYIENSVLAERVLQRINYYRLSAYALTFKDPNKNDQYIDGSSFSKLLSLYEFDRKLRLLLLGAMETIEIALRAHVSYEIAHNLGPLGYNTKENFIDETYHRDFLDEMNKAIQQSRKGELFIQHYFKKYNGEI